MRLLRLLLMGLAMAVGAGTGWAQSYPDKSKPLRILVPFGAASSTDILARALARGIGEVTGMNVFVENKAGAEGVIGMVTAKTAPVDGYTLVMTTSSTQVLNPHMLQNLPYDPVGDFIPVSGIAKFSLVMNAGPNVTQTSAREFISAARANPGKFSFGSGSTTTRLAGELLQYAAGIKMLSVPYKSLADAITAMAGGQVDIVIVDLPSSSAQHKTGRVRPLAVTGPARMAALPDVPTLQEEGVAEYEMTGWWAAYFPAKTPTATVAAMREIVQKASQTPYMKDALKTFALEPLPVVGDEMGELQRRDADKWGKLVRAAKLASP